MADQSGSIGIKQTCSFFYWSGIDQWLIWLIHYWSHWSYWPHLCNLLSVELYFMATPNNRQKNANPGSKQQRSIQFNIRVNKDKYRINHINRTSSFCDWSAIDPDWSWLVCHLICIDRLIRDWSDWCDWSYWSEWSAKPWYIHHKMATQYCFKHFGPKYNPSCLCMVNGCHGHGKVMDFLEFWNFLRFLEKSWKFD